MESRKMRWAGHVVRMGERRKLYRVLVRKPEGKIPLGRLRRKWENGIRMDLREDVEWVHLAQPVAGCCEYGSGSGATELVPYVFWGFIIAHPWRISHLKIIYF
jgi:hypothetical protein